MKRFDKFVLVAAVLVGIGSVWLAGATDTAPAPVPAEDTLTAVIKHPITIEEYRDENKEWRWRAKAHNGQIIFVASEGYQRRSTMQRVRDLTLLKLATENYKIVEVEK